MDRAEAIRALKLPTTRDRLAAARFFQLHATRRDAATVAQALSTEGVFWIRDALLAAQARIQGKGHTQSQTDSPITAEVAIARSEGERRSLEEMAATFLHEINPILGLIEVAAAGELQERFEGSETKKQLGRAKGVTEALAVLRDASRAPRIEDVDLGRLIQEVTDSERARFDPPPAIRTEVTQSADRCRGDSRLLDLALRNALRNAFEATKDAQSAAPVVVTWGTTDRDAWIDVRDSGVGLAAARGDIWQLGVSSKDGHPGVGLASMRRAMRSLGGDAFLTPNDSGIGCHLMLRWPTEGRVTT